MEIVGVEVAGAAKLLSIGNGDRALVARDEAADLKRFERAVDVDGGEAEQVRKLSDDIFARLDVAQPVREREYRRTVGSVEARELLQLSQHRLQGWSGTPRVLRSSQAGARAVSQAAAAEGRAPPMPTLDAQQTHLP